jgi:gamma-glutamylaminecyclotransferase
MRLFVYGTLKRNFFFHEAYLGQGKGEFVAIAHTGPGFKLYIDALPHMVIDRKGTGVKGEIFEVDEKTLKDIDDLEGHPTMYRREVIQVTDDNGEVLNCWAYLRPKHLFEDRRGVTVEEEFI